MQSNKLQVPSHFSITLVHLIIQGSDSVHYTFMTSSIQDQMMYSCTALNRIPNACPAIESLLMAMEYCLRKENYA